MDSGGEEASGIATFVSYINLIFRQFGKPGTMYDYTGVDIQQQREKAKELEELQKAMKKKINPKVLNMIDT